MTTFDLAEVRGFTADITDRLNRCDNGEGMACANLDATLRHYADRCCEFRERLRAWGRAVFYGRVPFDPDVERVWKEEGWRLYQRAYTMYGCGRESEGVCYTLDGQSALYAALCRLHEMFDPWVTPQLAVGPAARNRLTLSPEQLAEIRRQLDALPPLPADWEPDDPSQRAVWRKLHPPKPS